MFSSKYDVQYYTGIQWPYPVDYEKVNRIDTDFLIIGGGVAGCAAAMEAKKRGLNVLIVDKGPLVRSGSAGTGIDHWHDVATNPASQKDAAAITEWVKATPYWGGRRAMLHARYIFAKESYATLLDLEKLGMNIRDEDDFEGSDFVDPHTGLMYAYDYDNCVIVRLKGGVYLKPLMKAEIDRLGVDYCEYVSVTHLLTKDGKTGPDAQVIGAMGMSIRTGECYIFRCKAAMISSGIPSGEWSYSSEFNGNSQRFMDPNNVGEGQVMMIEIGTKLVQTEHTGLTCANGGMRWPMYGVGNCDNTWYGCPIVDADGKQIPWERNGKPADPEGIYRNTWPGVGDNGAYTSGNIYELPANLPDRILSGEFKQPFYADLPSMPADERRVLFGLMVGNEGKTYYPIYKVYTANGFDPDVDMLQVPVVMPSNTAPKRCKPFWNGEIYDPWRESQMVSNMPVVDWTLMTTTKGLFAAGQTIGMPHSAGAYTTGWYAGRNAVKFIKEQNEPLYPIDEAQFEKWKEFDYAPVYRPDAIGWKEFKAGCARVMQGNCGLYKSKEILQNGLDWFETIENSEFKQLSARNPHELARTHECYAQMFMSKVTLTASMARTRSSQEMGFYRIDYPEIVDSDDDMYVTITMEDGKLVTGELPLAFYLKPPYSADYEENYQKYAAFDA